MTLLLFICLYENRHTHTLTHAHTYTHIYPTIQTALSRNLKKKGSFSPEEDQIILQIIRNWDTDDTDDRQYVPAGSGSKNNHSPILGTFLEDAVGCCSERRSGSSSSSGRGSGDVAHYEESRQLLLSSSTKEHIDYTGNSLSSSGISNSGAQEWLGTGVGVGTGVRLGTGTGSGLGTGGRSGGILSPGNVKKNKVPRKGKWVVVGDALNRPPDCCSQRYRDTLIKRPYPLS